MSTLEKMDIRQENEVFEQAVYTVEGTAFEVLQLMGDIEVDEFIEEAGSVLELQASIPVIGQYQYIKVDFKRGLKDALTGWDTDATGMVDVDVDDFIGYIPSNAEQVSQLTPEQLYALATLFVDVYAYTSFEDPNILEDFVDIKEG